MIKVRFAPSPTGYLHLGNGRAAIFNYLFTKSVGGKFVLRIDDTDKERSKIEYENSIYEDLKWIGIEFDEKYTQSLRKDLYESAFQKLKSAGKIYPCYETKEELEELRQKQISEKKPPLYCRQALELSEEDIKNLEKSGRKPHWRFKLSREKIKFDDLIHGEITFDLGSVSDPVIRKADGDFTYTFASCVDDVDIGISHIIRGDDHVSNTASQIEIFKALDENVDIKFGHYPLINFEDHGKMSKRLNDLSLRHFRNEGLESDTVVSFLAKIGTSDQVKMYRNFDDLVAEFSFEKISTANPKIFLKDLFDLNRKNYATMEFSDAKARFQIEDEKFWTLIHENLSSNFEIEDWKKICFAEIDKPHFDDAEFLKIIYNLLQTKIIDQKISENWAELWINLVKENVKYLKSKDIFMNLMKIIVGKTKGPKLVDILDFIGIQKTKNRIENLM